MGEPIVIGLAGRFVRPDGAIMKEDEKMNVKYPNIRVKLVGEDGNAFAIMGRVDRALRKARVSMTERNAYRNEAMSGDYNHLLATTMKWVETY